MRKRKGGWGLGALVGAGTLLALGGMAFAGQDGGGSGGWPNGGLGGGGFGGGGSGGGGEPWTPGPGGGGRVYGSSDSKPGWLPHDFDFDGNGLWLSPDCIGVIEGSKFRPDPKSDTIYAIEPPEWEGYQPEKGMEVEAVQKVDSGNSIAGFVDWAMGHTLPDPPAAFAAWVNAHMKAVQRPKASLTAIRITAEILAQVSPICVGMTDFEEQWGDGVKHWLEDFLLWLDLYLHEFWQGEIELDVGSS